MPKSQNLLNDNLIDFISKQHIFFVASAPLDKGHVNVSPKGLDTFTVINSNEVAYLDLTGSGVETIAHVKQNGRLTIMFCAFEGEPKILRLFGKAQVIIPQEAEFNSLMSNFPPRLGARAIIKLHIEKIRSSCGFGVPLMTYESERPDLDRWSLKKGPQGLEEYRKNKNAQSIDGLEGLK